MRRRSFLAACGTCFVAIAGCVGDRDQGASSTSDYTERDTDSDDESDEQGASSTPDHTEHQNPFRSAVEQNAENVQSVSLNGTEWTVAYSTEVCCGDPLKSHQAALARNFSSVRPENVSLNVTTFHECMNIHWRIPAQLARKHRSGEIDTETYVRRVQNTTSTENKC